MNTTKELRVDSLKVEQLKAQAIFWRRHNKNTLPNLAVLGLLPFTLAGLMVDRLATSVPSATLVPLLIGLVMLSLSLILGVGVMGHYADKRMPMYSVCEAIVQLASEEQPLYIDVIARRAAVPPIYQRYAGEVMSALEHTQHLVHQLIVQGYLLNVKVVVDELQIY